MSASLRIHTGPAIIVYFQHRNAPDIRPIFLLLNLSDAGWDNRILEKTEYTAEYVADSFWNRYSTPPASGRLECYFITCPTVATLLLFKRLRLSPLLSFFSALFDDNRNIKLFSGIPSILSSRVPLFWFSRVLWCTSLLFNIVQWGSVATISLCIGNPSVVQSCSLSAVFCFPVLLSVDPCLTPFLLCAESWWFAEFHIGASQRARERER